MGSRIVHAGENHRGSEYPDIHRDFVECRRAAQLHAGIRVVGTSQRNALFARISELLKYARREGYRVDDVVSPMRSI